MTRPLDEMTQQVLCIKVIRIGLVGLDDRLDPGLGRFLGVACCFVYRVLLVQILLLSLVHSEKR